MPLALRGSESGSYACGIALNFDPDDCKRTMYIVCDCYELTYYADTHTLTRFIRFTLPTVIYSIMWFCLLHAAKALQVHM